MPTMISALIDGEVISIDDAIVLRDRSIIRPDFSCIECNEPVRAHKSGGNASAHFEHLSRNPDCPLSHVAP